MGHFIAFGENNGSENDEGKILQFKALIAVAPCSDDKIHNEKMADFNPSE